MPRAPTIEQRVAKLRALDPTQPDGVDELVAAFGSNNGFLVAAADGGSSSASTTRSFRSST